MALEWSDWQLQVFRKAAGDPDKCKVHWYWGAEVASREGPVLAEHMNEREDTIVLSTKGPDMLYRIAKYMRRYTDGPRVVVYIPPDFPNARNPVAYAELDKIKAGSFYSRKYRGAVCTFATPHVFIFSNAEPDRRALSEHKWDVHHVE